MGGVVIERQRRRSGGAEMIIMEPIGSACHYVTVPTRSF
jgi:hypothetical protein